MLAPSCVKATLRRVGLEESGASSKSALPFAGLRRKIAQNMSLSQASTAAHFTYVEECDVSELKALRDRLVGPAEAAGAKLSFLPLGIVEGSSSRRWKKHPVLNATAHDEAKGEIVHTVSITTLGSRRRRQLASLRPRREGTRIVRACSISCPRRWSDWRTTPERGKAEAHEDLHGSTFTITSLNALGGLSGGRRSSTSQRSPFSACTR